MILNPETQIKHLKWATWYKTSQRKGARRSKLLLISDNSWRSDVKWFQEVQCYFGRSQHVAMFLKEFQNYENGVRSDRNMIEGSMDDGGSDRWCFCECEVILEGPKLVREVAMFCDIFRRISRTQKWSSRRSEHDRRVDRWWGMWSMTFLWARSYF